MSAISNFISSISSHFYSNAILSRSAEETESFSSSPYQEGLKNRELDEEAPQIFWLNQGALSRPKPRCENEKYELNRRCTKTDSSFTSGIKTDHSAYFGMIYKTNDCLKRFGLGCIAATGLINPISKSLVYLAKVGKLIPDLSYEDNIRAKISALENNGLKNFDIDKLLKAPCYLEEYVKQVNSHFDKPRLDVSLIKMSFFENRVFLPAIQEEFLFRGLMQDVLLNQIPKKIIRRIAPGREIALDSSIAKVVRIVLVAIAFWAAHTQNRGILQDGEVDVQLVSNFALGIGLGVLKESKAGLLGAIGAHMAHNFIETPPLWCSAVNRFGFLGGKT